VLGLVPDAGVDVEVLVFGAEERPDDLALGAVAVQFGLDVGARELRAEVALDPVNRRVRVGHATLQRVGVRVVVEVLERTELDVRVLARDDLDEVREVPVAVDAVVTALDRLEDRHRRRLLGDDQRLAEQRAGVHFRAYRHVLDVDALGDVDERPGREERDRQRGEVVVFGIEYRPEVRLDDVAVLVECLAEG